MFSTVKTVLTTYRRADGKPILGEYAFMTDYDGLEEEDSDVVEEQWVLSKSRTIPHPEPWAELDEDHLYEEEDEPVRKFRDQ